jgi:hypothetical protein
MLVGVGLAALVFAIVSIARGGLDTGGPPPAWSQWQPQDGGALGAREIADHFAPFYRINGVDQLAVVTVDDVSGNAAGTPGAGAGGLAVALKLDPGNGAISLLPGRTVAFNLCGINSNDCSIGVGQASSNRLLLLRREALELALYTFKYVSGTQNVVALLPPGYTTEASTLTKAPPVNPPSTVGKPVHLALLFVSDEMKQFVDAPSVASTLPLLYPPTIAQLPQWLQTSDAALTQEITAHGMFTQQLTTAEDGSNLLILDQLPPQ